MKFFKSVQTYFAPEPKAIEPATMAHLARKVVHAGTGLQMMVADAANQTMRHCRIGMVYPKREREQ